MEISVKDVLKMHKDNDVAGMRELLDTAGLDTECWFPYAPIVTHMATIILSAAAAMASLGKLSDDMARLLIERLAIRCELYDIMGLILLATEAESSDVSVAVKKAVAVILSDRYKVKKEVVKTFIESLDKNELKTLMYTLTYDGTAGDTITRDLNSIIVQYLYEKSVVPAAMLFGFMGSSLVIQRKDDPIDEAITALLEAKRRQGDVQYE